MNVGPKGYGTILHDIRAILDESFFSFIPLAPTWYGVATYHLFASDESFVEWQWDLQEKVMVFYEDFS